MALITYPTNERVRNGVLSRDGPLGRATLDNITQEIQL